MASWLDLDPRLPGLGLAFDLDAVSRLFEHRWPAAGRGQPRAVRARRVLDTKYRPASGCVTTYDLFVQAAAGGRGVATMGVVEVTPTGVGHRLLHDDPGLPGLATALDAGAMGDRLAALPVVAAAAGGAPVGSCEATPVRYRPGSRCVVRYRVRTASMTLSFFGKVLGAGGDRLAATVEALHRVARASPGMPEVPEPVAYWPDLHLLVQPEVVGGVALGAVAFDASRPLAAREAWMGRTGAALAALHASAGSPGPGRSVDDDLAELSGYAPTLSHLAPALGPAYGEALEELASSVRDRPRPEPVPSHGAFRADQVLAVGPDGAAPRPGGSGLALLDLDGFCWADPARDLGNLLAYLRWKAIRHPPQAPFVSRARRAFLDGYARVRTPPAPAWVSVFEAASLLKIAGRRYRSLCWPEWPLVPGLVGAALDRLGPDPRPRSRLPASKGPPGPGPGTTAARGPAALAAALDAEAATLHLAPLLAPTHPSGSGARIAGARLVAWNRGRGLVRYEVAGPRPGPARAVLGKVYEDPVRGAAVHGVMRSLWAEVFAGCAGLGVPRPLGWVPALSMVVYDPAPGSFLDEVLARPGPAGALDLAAAWLARLHGSGLAPARRFCLDDEVANAESWAARVPAGPAGQVTPATRIAAALRERAASLVLDTAVPIHKDFHHRHAIVDGSGPRPALNVIDFDEVRLGDPSFDLAHFCAYLHLLAHRTGMADGRRSELEGRFLDSYARRTGWHVDDRFQYFFAYTCLKIAKQLCLGTGLHPRPGGDERRRQVRATLAAGAAAADRVGGGGP